MKKPIHGDELTIRYQGATVTARCNDVTELPKNGPGAAKLTIHSKVLFHNGGQATLTDGATEMPLRVERVTSLPHERTNLISFYGLFDAPAEVATASPSP